MSELHGSREISHIVFGLRKKNPVEQFGGVFFEKIYCTDRQFPISANKIFATSGDNFTCFNENFAMTLSNFFAVFGFDCGFVSVHHDVGAFRHVGKIHSRFVDCKPASDRQIDRFTSSPETRLGNFFVEDGK